MRTIGDSRYLEIITRLRLARRARGLTQGDVAEMLSVPQSFVSKYETGERRLDVVELLDICFVLGIEIQDVLPGKGREKRL